MTTMTLDFGVATDGDVIQDRVGNRYRIMPGGKGAALLCCAWAKNKGRICANPVIQGMDKCRKHCGKKTEVAKAEGQANLEIARLEAAWGQVRTHTDPGEALLDMVSISRARVGLLAQRLGEMWTQLEKLGTSGTAMKGQVKDAVLSGGDLALVGYTYSATNEGKIYATAEGIRGLAKMESEERDRCARYSKSALDAGIAERQVRLAERMGEIVAGVAVAVLLKYAASIGREVDTEDPLVVEVIRTAIESVAG